MNTRPLLSTLFTSHLVAGDAEGDAGPTGSQSGSPEPTRRAFASNRSAPVYRVSFSHQLLWMWMWSLECGCCWDCHISGSPAYLLFWSQKTSLSLYCHPLYCSKGTQTVFGEGWLQRRQSRWRMCFVHWYKKKSFFKHLVTNKMHKF